MLTKALQRYNTLAHMGQLCSFSSANDEQRNRSKYLIETEEVAQLIKEAPSNLRFVNATWFMPNNPRNAKAEHEGARLTETTQFFNIDTIAEPGSNLPHTLPSAAVFSEHMKGIRVRKTDQIICYDATGMFSVARAAWMFRYFGADNVRIMSGGFQKWMDKEGRGHHSGAYSPGQGLPEDGDYSYEVVDETKAITDINKVHNVAYHLVNNATDW